MRLELHRARVRDIAFGERTELKGGLLTVDREALIALLSKDEHLAKVEADLARPGERIRILPVKDVLEPRCKLSGEGDVFPGMLGDVETVGSGSTLVLEGAAVVTCGRIVGFQEGIVDMSGPGAEYTPFSRTNNLVLTFAPVEGLGKYEHETACRMAGQRAAAWLARSVAEAGFEADRIESFELPSFLENGAAHPGLPKIAYLYMLQSQGLLHDTYVYGIDAKRILPTLIHPNEVMDGAITSGNCVSACDKNSTYAHQNNPVIRALYARHGVDFCFLGCILTNENVTLADKRRSSAYAVKLAKMLGADGLVISEEGFGNPDADLIMNCRRAENLGIRTVLITDEFAGRDGASQSLADVAKEADAVVTGGNANALIVLPPMERVIGCPEFADIIAGGFAGSLRADGSIEVELQAITGATSELGLSNIGAFTI
jgi:glycine reductase